MIAVPDPIAMHAAREGGRPALVGPERACSYAELDERTASAVARLHEIGCRPGTRVALYLDHSVGYVVLLLALLRAGCVACPLSTRLPRSAVPGLLRRIAGRYLIAHDNGLATPGGDYRVVLPESLSSGPRATAASGALPLDRPATIIFTSGSSGAPKAALHTWGNHYYSALGSNRNIILQPGDRWLLSLPLYHVGGLGILFRCLLAGATIVVPAPGELPSRAIARLGITHASMVGTQLYRAFHAGETDWLSGLKALLLGGSALPPSLVEQAHAAGLPVHTSYGLTEMASQVATTPHGAALGMLATSGHVLPYREVRLAKDGEILVRGETLFAGYVDGDEVVRPVDAEGWYHTRDLGEWDASGALVVRGRRDNMFISGGENIQPEEIERALCSLAGVAEAIVVPVPDEEFGARPVAFVRTYPDATADDLGSQLRRHLPGFKIPVAFLAWPPPLGEEGMKIDRSYLAGQAAEQIRRV